MIDKDTILSNWDLSTVSEGFSSNASKADFSSLYAF